METNSESVNNHDGEGERPRLSIFLVNGEYSAFQPQYRTLTYDEMHSAHNHCLFNCDEITPYIEYVTLDKLLAFVNLKIFKLSKHAMHILQTTPRNR